MKTDGNGRKTALHFHEPPKRVVSLVPSMTESMFELGFGDAIVGITDYCTNPASELQAITRVGGPKDPRVTDILGLDPELVLANWEENTRQVVEALEAADVPVWVTFPRTVRAALDILWTLVGLYGSREAAMRVEILEMSLEWARNAASERPSVRYFCPIWRDRSSEGISWWMTFNQGSYAHDVLSVLGGENIFATRERHYPLEADLGLVEAQDPGERDTRYPRITLEEVRTANPQLILLPTEPFLFTDADRQELIEYLPECDAIQKGQLVMVDGSLITWHGSRLARALRELPELLYVE